MAMQKFLVSTISLLDEGDFDDNGTPFGYAHWKLRSGDNYAVTARSRGAAMAHVMEMYGRNGKYRKAFPESVVPLDQHIAEWEGELRDARFHLSSVRARIKDAGFLGLSDEEVMDLQADEQSTLQGVDMCKGHLNMDERYPHWVDGGVAA